MKAVKVFDLETAAAWATPHDAPAFVQEWFEKLKISNPDKSDEDLWHENATLTPETGKIVAASIAAMDERGATFQQSWKADPSDKTEEAALISTLCRNLYKPGKTCHIGGHNIIEFDIPFLCRRALYLGIAIDENIHQSMRKPWERNHIDTMAALKFGSWKGNVGLRAASVMLGMPDCKSSYHGSLVSMHSWKEWQDLGDTIKDYCLEDSKVTLNLLIHLGLNK